MAGSSTESVVQTVRLGLAALRDSAAVSDDARRSGGGGDGAQTMSGRQVKTAVSESVERIHLRATSGEREHPPHPISHPPIDSAALGC
jgi:hypothetical protein